MRNARKEIQQKLTWNGTYLGPCLPVTQKYSGARFRCVCVPLFHTLSWTALCEVTSLLCHRTNTRDFDQHGCTTVSETHCHSWVSLTVDAGVWRGRTPGITMADTRSHCVLKHHRGIPRVYPQSLLVSKNRSDFVLRLKVWRFWHLTI